MVTETNDGIEESYRYGPRRSSVKVGALATLCAVLLSWEGAFAQAAESTGEPGPESTPKAPASDAQPPAEAPEVEETSEAEEVENKESEPSQADAASQPETPRPDGAAGPGIGTQEPASPPAPPAATVSQGATSPPATSPPATSPPATSPPAVPESGGTAVSVGLGVKKSADDPGADTGSKSIDDFGRGNSKSGHNGLILAADLSTYAGTGNFYGSGFAHNPHFYYELGLVPTWEFKDKTRLSLRAGLNQELTLSESTAGKRQLLFDDLRLGLERKIYKFANGGPSLTGFLYAYAPTSLLSQGETLRTALEGRVNVAQRVGPLTLSWRPAFRKNFHAYTSPVVDLAGDLENTCLSRSGGAEKLEGSRCSPGGNNKSYSVSNRLAVSTSAGGVLFGLQYILAHSWAYNDVEDANGVCLSNNPADCPGRGLEAREGRGRSDVHVGNLFAAYELSSSWSLVGGLLTQGPTRTADDDRIRFPFFDTESQELNLTTLYLSVGFTEPTPLRIETSEENHAKLDSH